MGFALLSSVVNPVSVDATQSFTVTQQAQGLLNINAASSVSVVIAAVRLIQTQNIFANVVLTGQAK